MEERNKRSRRTNSLEPGIFLQWGNKKRLRCLRVKDPQISQDSNSLFRRRMASRFLEKERFLFSSSRFARDSQKTARLSSPEKEDRFYPTRGSVEKFCLDGDNNGEDKDNKSIVWPKLYITLSSKEKEEDFMAMKGCKPPQRPKKRAKLIQRSLLLVSPGAWLTDMCQDRYEVREKKSSSKKRARGLKAMGNAETDSE